MIRNDLDDSIDDVLQRVRGSSESQWGAWVRQAPQEFVSDPEASQYARNAFRLADALHRMPRPAPRTGFPDRVIAALAAPAPRWTDPRSTLRIAATVLYAAAAVLFAAFGLVIHPANEPAPVVSVDAPTPDVAVALREGAVAYAELVQTLAGAAVGPPSTALIADEERWAAATSPVGMAVRGSTKSMQTARQELQATVEPVAMSALDAFGFLWKPANAPPSDPST